MINAIRKDPMPLALFHIQETAESRVPVDQPDIERALGGDQQAYKQLYERHVDALFRFFMQFSADREQVADWVQLAFIKAFQNLDRFAGRSKFKTWLFQIAINEMRQTMRRAHREPDYLEPDKLYAYSEQPRSPADWISLRDQIRKLPERPKLVFLLYEIEGYSHAEIAAMLDIAESTSRSILTRVKIDLRQTLTDL